MKLLSTLVLTLLLSIGALAQENKEYLLGEYQREALLQEPYNKWFTKNYDDYTPDAELVNQLKSVKPNDYTFKVFTGTWCGDTYRELPRLLKLFDAIKINPKSIQLIGLSSVDSVYKQSPDGHEKGLNIYRVPTVVVYKKGIEVNRIVEFPVESLEHDLLAIFSDMGYVPSYRSYPYVTQWYNRGLLSNPNISAFGLANQVRDKVNGISEISNCAQLYLNHGKLKEALTLFKVNVNLFPDNPLAYYRLAMAYKANMEYARAAIMLENAIRLDKTQTYLKDFLEIYKELIQQNTNTSK